MTTNPRNSLWATMPKPARDALSASAKAFSKAIRDGNVYMGDDGTWQTPLLETPSEYRTIYKSPEDPNQLPLWEI